MLRLLRDSRSGKSIRRKSRIHSYLLNKGIILLFASPSGTTKDYMNEVNPIICLRGAGSICTERKAGRQNLPLSNDYHKITLPLLREEFGFNKV